MNDQDDEPIPIIYLGGKKVSAYMISEEELSRLRRIEAAAIEFLNEGNHYYHGTGACPGCKRCDLEKALEQE